MQSKTHLRQRAPASTAKFACPPIEDRNSGIVNVLARISPYPHSSNNKALPETRRLQTTEQGTAQPANHAAETILVVEDSKVEQERLRAILRRFGYHVLTADNGQQALEILTVNPIRVVLSDWRMPKISGIELCRAVRADPASGQPYIILVTGQNAKSDLIAGMDAGADDFISKPFSSEEVRVRVQAGVHLLDLRRQSEQRSQQLVAALEREAQTTSRIRQDLAIAARMQRESLPTGESPFPQLDIGTLFQAASEVAGDSYDFFRLDDQHLAFYLIDIAGHGVAAAMLSFTVSRFLAPETGPIALCNADGNDDPQRRLPGHIVPPHTVVHALNQRFVDKHNCGHYFNMVYGVLNVTSGVGELCQAGHPRPMVVTANGETRRLGKGGFPVGMLEQASYNSVAFHLGADERLFIYSDGITDCQSTDGEQIGEQRFANLLGQTHTHPLATGIERLEQHLRQWQNGAAGKDDISMLAIARPDARRPEQRD